MDDRSKMTADRVGIRPDARAAAPGRWLEPLLDHFIALGRSPGGDRELRANRDAVLTTVRQAVEAGCEARAIQLVRVAEGALATPATWGAWGSLLQLALRAARGVGDRSTEGWALHQLGVRERVAGDPGRAGELLAEALTVRTVAGDVEAAALTRSQLADLVMATTI